MNDDVPKHRVEGTSGRAPTFSTEQAANFAKTRENASKRNRALLKELEVQAAKLRSRTCFCPTELQLYRLQAKYEEEMRATELGKVLHTLRHLSHLYSLTLHGNPLEEHRKYRARILCSLPQLRSLDFTNVTVSDKLHLNKVKRRSTSFKT
ncbi:leucine-rich repeat-containing protein 51 isoform X2 [Cryptotermes secundus]|uniref:leucine-rich repeat-containing protein 51 isoform X2 n=1 Tax=Cryptotermes secundus TaxID=105785 RepID=UPI000CD7B383|nr:leucine-rich repeat-containing protein 51 isoform X2 [Cryptotermes secundus]